VLGSANTEIYRWQHPEKAKLRYIRLHLARKSLTGRLEKPRMVAHGYVLAPRRGTVTAPVALE
jgi:hypothetical protein